MDLLINIVLAIVCMILIFGGVLWGITQNDPIVKANKDFRNRQRVK